MQRADGELPRRPNGGEASLLLSLPFLSGSCGNRIPTLVPVNRYDQQP